MNQHTNTFHSQHLRQKVMNIKANLLTVIVIKIFVLPEFSLDKDKSDSEEDENN